MSPYKFLLDRLQLLEQRMKVLEDARGIDRDQTILAMQEMSKTIGMMMAQLLPILNERRIIDKAMKEAAIERMFEIVAKTQKYPM